MPNPMLRLTLNARGADVKDLHEKLGKLGYVIPQNELDEQVLGVGTREALLKLQKKQKLPGTGILDDATNAALAGAAAGAGAGKYRVEGRIVFEYGLPAANVSLRLYNRGFGDAATLIGEFKTDAQGIYAHSYSPGDGAANLEVRAVGAQGAEIPLSATKFSADRHEVLNLVAPASVRPLKPEFDRLTESVAKTIGGIDKLAAARERAERQDLAVLHGATRWDARLIALAARAVALGAETGIPQDALYALFRAGLPTDAQQLASASATVFEKALRKANEAGIVSINDRQIAKAKTAFAKFARDARRSAKAPGVLSNVDEMMAKSGLTDAERGTFEDLYFTYGDAPAELWKKARDKGISEAKIKGLRLQGKLAYLTLNNADLAASLQGDIGSPDDLAHLVDRDFYRADAWKARLNELARNDEKTIAKLIPPAYEGEKTAERLEAYAADNARKVRLNFPNQVVGRMIEKGEIRLGGRYDAVKTSVCTFLKNGAGLGFELGRVPIDAFINDKKNRKELFKNIPPADVEATMDAVKRLQRLYQITPTDEALGTAFDLDFTSAQDVVAFPYEVFVKRFGKRFPSEDEARLVYRKAQQVSAVTHGLLTAARQLDVTPSVHAMSPSIAARENAKQNLIKHYPTMESLFGSLDFCECEHCRSVLSPAAYLVDLLQFVDTPDQVWKDFLGDWKTRHGGERYQSDWNYDHSGEVYEDQRKKPYYALIERRPDLPNLPLTCENTHTAMPYIDIVNEILEYYVVKGGLSSDSVHDTGAATTPELLAEPQNILPEAYEKLKNARYPLGLPFDLWLETVRRFCEYFETPLWQVLEVLRPSDDLFAPAANPKPYYRSAIFAEFLGLSPAEYAIFTAADAPATWFELYGYPTEAEALVKLRSAKTLSRRLGISYRELADLACTGFVNPTLDALVILKKLGIDVHDVFRYKGRPGYPAFTPEEKEAFEKRLEALTGEFNPTRDANGFNAGTWLEKAWQDGRFNKILLLADPSTGCNFDETTLRYADGTPADAPAFLKINLIVRLRRKLGWTIEETDRALQTFLPKNALPLAGATFGKAFETTLPYLAHLKAIDERVKVGKQSRLKLLTFWSNLPTTGKNPLYAQLFLTRSILKNDAVFDDPLGMYLSKAGILIKDHLLAVQGALNLTADDVERILADAGKTTASAELSLDNVTLLYRYGLLAKAAKLPVRDLIALKALSGLDPFKALKADPISTLADDYPFSRTIRFIEIAEKVKESGFKVEDIEYALRHCYDPVGKYRPRPEVQLALVRSLAADIRRIQTEHSVPVDPSGLTDDTLREKLCLVLPSDVVETFLGFWKDTVEFSAVKENVAANQKLDPGTYEVKDVRVAYDAMRQWQRVVHVGVLTDAKKADILSKVPAPAAGAPQEKKDAYANFQSLLSTIAAQSQPQSKAFFDKYFDGFITYDDLYGAAAAGLSIEAKRQKVLAAFLPFVQKILIRRLIAQALAAALAGDPALTEALLTDADVLADPIQPPPPAGQPAEPLLATFKKADRQGVTADFYASPDLSGNALESGTTVGTVDGTAAPAGAQSARFKGYIEVPATGAYRFFAQLGKTNAEVEFRLGLLPDPVILKKATRDNDEFGDFVELKQGVLHEFTLDVRNLQGGTFALLVKGDATPKDRLNQLALYPYAVVDGMRRAWVLLAKVLQLIQGFELSEREVRYVLTHEAEFDNIDLSKLPTREADDTPAGAAALFGQFLRLADYVRLKRGAAGGTDDLIGIFERARRTLAATVDAAAAEAALVEELSKRVADLTRRDASAVRAAAQHLGFAAKSAPAANGLTVEAPDFSQEKGVWRLWEVLQLLERLGLPVDKLARSTGIVAGTAGSKERFEIARDLRSAVKARYEADSWQRIAQAVFDTLRQRQRDALVAYIMHHDGFERMEQLFEYFLIDPGMEPVVQTSRLRLAISSVQLFIQRCLLNLEPRVHPSTIDSKRWRWMKRYRVWEVNRKIFLFPENWLEPEFRDDKTFLFQELESSLLQGDVSNDLAEDAFFRYLKKLEELARLEIVSMYCEEKQNDPDSNALHVIGRTFTGPHKYFYRRYADRMWTPWEPVTAEIEGDHIAAVVWRERLHLFWVTFLEKAKPESGTTENAGDTRTLDQVTFGDVVTSAARFTKRKKVLVQLHWSEYYQGQWTTRESGGLSNPATADAETDPSGSSIIADVYSTFDSSSVFIHVSKETDDEDGGAVRINLGYPISRAFRVVSKNSPPECVGREYPQLPPYAVDRIQATMHTGSKALKVWFAERIEIESGKPPSVTANAYDILRRCDRFSLLFQSNLKQYPLLDYAPGLDPSYNPWFLLAFIDPRLLASPFFYQDNRFTFFVDPSFSEVTVERWERWGIGVPAVDVKLHDDDWWKKIPVEAEVPLFDKPSPPEPIDPLARFKVQEKRDWVTDPATVLRFDDRLVGRSGGIDVEALPAEMAKGNLDEVINVGSGGLNSVLLDAMSVRRGASGSKSQGNR